MRYLVVAPQLGFTPSGHLIPGGLLQFGRCVVRALASSPSITKLAVWCQVDSPAVSDQIRQMIDIHAYPKLDLEIKCFGGSQTKLATDVIRANIERSYNRVMYLLVNQSILSLFPIHIPYEVWEIGEELFHPISLLQLLSLSRANRLLSISYHTTVAASTHNPRLPLGDVVHLCLEPPICDPMPPKDPVVDQPFKAKSRDMAVLIVANMHSRLLYKGHQQLILGWPIVNHQVPNAELWIVGDGDGRKKLETLKDSLPFEVSKRVKFFGYVEGEELERLYNRCRVFAMPSTGEGFGLVFVEAARHGLPCIGGKHDSVREIVLDNQTGILVEQRTEDVADACIRLLNDDDLAERLGQASRRRYLDTFQYAHFRTRLLSVLGLSS